LQSIRRGKLDERAEKCVFVGFATESKGCRIFNLSEAKIMISKDVHFIAKPSEVVAQSTVKAACISLAVAANQAL
jgi:hypothetical protein